MTPEQAKVDPIFKADTSAAPAGRAEPGVPAGSLGAALRSLRESRGWSVADVSARLKFSNRQIEALEADQWDALPQGPSLRGLVRNYARLLDVAPDTMLQALPAHLLPRPAPVAHLSAVEGGEAELPSGTTLPGWSSPGRGRALGLGLLILILLAGVALAAYLFFAWWLPRSQGVEADAPVSLPFMLEESGSSSEVAGPVSGTIGNVPDTVLPSVSGVAAPAGPQGSPSTSLPAGSESSIPSVNASDDASLAPTPNSASAAPGDSGAGASTAAASPGDASALPGSAASAQASSPTAPFVVPGMEGAGAAATEAGESAEASVAEPPAEPAPVGDVVAFEVSAESWIEVRNASGDVVLSATLQPGDLRTLEVDPPARIVIGNASGVTLQWQGQSIDLADHQRGNVARLTLE